MCTIGRKMRYMLLVYTYTTESLMLLEAFCRLLAYDPTAHGHITL